MASPSGVEVSIGRVGNVPQNVLEAAFMPYGATSIRLLNGIDRAIATFQTFEAAGQAILSLNGTKLDAGLGEGLLVKFADFREKQLIESHPAKVFVGNLNAFSTEGAVTELCQQYGTVKEVKIIRKEVGKAPFGVVTFTTMDEAERCCSNLNGFQHDLSAQGKTLSVRIADADPSKVAPAAPVASIAPIVAQAPLADARFQGSSWTQPMGAMQPMGAGAFAPDVDEGFPGFSWMQPMGATQPVGAGAFASDADPDPTGLQRSLLAAQKGERPQIFIGGLPENATDEMIFGLLSPFGAVTEAWAHKKRGAPSSCGFARFAHLASAQMAVATIHQLGRYNIKFSEWNVPEEKSGSTGRPGKRDNHTAFPPSEELPGDWICPACSAHNLAKNITCRTCATPKPGEVALGANGGYARRMGDWNCGSCGDSQFARNTTCRKCGTPNPVLDQGVGDLGARPTAMGGYNMVVPGRILG